MAGIGFELYKILQKGTLGSMVQAFLLGTIIAAGPWLLSVTSIYVIQKYAGTAIAESPTLFTVSIVYIYAFSLFFFGGVHYIFSRFIADMMYIENDKAIPSGLVVVTILMVIISAAMGSLFLVFNDFKIQHETLYRVSFVCLFVVINIIWILLIYIALLKEYYKIFVAYFIGVIICILGVYKLGKDYSIAGALAGYTIGQAVIALLLVLISLKSYPIRLKNINFALFGYFGKFKYLFFTGLFLNMAIWIDKLMYWVLYGTNIKGTLFYYFADYDIPVFLAFISMIPGIVYFMIVSETQFHTVFIEFMENILKATMAEIQKHKKAVIKNLRSGIIKLVMFQGIWTGGLLANTEFFINFMGFGGVDVRVMQILLVAVLFHMMLLVLQIYLLYMELRTEAVMSTVVYFGFNLVLTTIFMLIGVPYPGLSYLIASALAASYCGFYLYKKTPIIDYIIYSKT